MTELALRPATGGDAEAVWRIRNEEQVREASFDTRPIQLDAHRQWFRARLQDASTRIFIVDVAGQTVGFVRLDLDRQAEISVALSSTARGRGLGRAAIRSATLTALLEPGGPERVVARVRPENSASLRVFSAAGFREISREDDVVELAFTLDEA